MDEPLFLGIDVGATKIAWGVFNQEGTLFESGQVATPDDPEPFLAIIGELIAKKSFAACGVGIAGTVSANHEDVLVCTNLPHLSHVQLTEYIKEAGIAYVILENDARCALIGEVWKGVAHDMTSAVMLTLGTGVGGAVMQKGIVLPHPQDVSLELGRIMVDPSDPFPAPTGSGSLEGFLGGRNLEDRFGVDLAVMTEKVDQGNKEAGAFWDQVSYYFLLCMRIVHDQFSCKTVIIGGAGGEHLEHYLRAGALPCPVVAAGLGSQAGLYGAVRLGIDHYLEETDESWD